MQLFAYNLVLALIWTFLTGRVSVGGLSVGFVLGYFVLAMVYRASETPTRYFRKTRQFIGFVFYFLRELVVSTLKVAYDVLTPTHYMDPGIVGIPLDAQSDLEVTLLANLITLTPGTLSLEVSEDRRTLYIHAMYVKNADADAVRREIKEGLERRLLELLR